MHFCLYYANVYMYITAVLIGYRQKLSLKKTMSYLLKHHPHILSDLLLRLHKHRLVSSEPSPQTSVSPAIPRQLSHAHYLALRLLFWFRGVSAAKKLLALVAVVAVPAAVQLGTFMKPQSVAFSFAGDTCFSNPNLFPAANREDGGSAFELDQIPAASFGTTPIFSTKTCIFMRDQPQKNTSETLTITAPLGIKKSVSVMVDTIPELLETQTIDQNISGLDALTFTLNMTDSNFSYRLVLAETAIDCGVKDTQISCPLNSLSLPQGQQFPYVLRRYLNSSYVEIHSGSVQTSEPVGIYSASIQPDETVLTHVTEISLQASKDIAAIDTATLLQGDAVIASNTEFNGTTVTIKTTEPLPRSATFTLSVGALKAADGGYLPEPYSLTFHTSGGPHVQGVNISKTGVNVDTTVQVTMNIGLLPGQSGLASITIGGQQIDASVTYSGQVITINPVQHLPKCSDFTVHVAGGSTSIFGVGDGTAWSYTARTKCHDSFNIGSSVNGRGIVAYKFGSGANTVVFVGGMHGDERSSVRTLDAWVDELEANFGRIPADKTIVVIPKSNPDGYASSSRRNAHNVDLNRNFPANDWTANVYQPGNVLIEGGGGSTPLSEPESSALASYVQASDPSLVLTYHAVARTVIYNGSGSSASLASTYGSLSGFSVSSSEAEDGIFSYPTTGEFENWLHDKVGIPCLLIENATMSSNEINNQKSAMWAVIGG